MKTVALKKIKFYILDNKRGLTLAKAERFLSTNQKAHVNF